MCKCKVCGKENYPINTKKFPKDFCSYKCYEEWCKFNKTPNCKCVVCGREMYLKPSRLKRIKNGITCCKECSNKLKSEYMKGDKNHQFGLIGNKNVSFKDENLITNYGYLLEYCPGHPYPHDRSNHTTRVLQHRLVVERNSDLFDPVYFEIIDGWKVLKPEYEVHHKNEDKQDNRIENLQVMTKSEHISYHDKERKTIRDCSGKFIGVVKSSNIGEGCDVNPEINSEIAKGSESSYSVEGE